MPVALAPSIAIVDVDAGIPHAEIERVAAALTRQVLEHAGPAWGFMACVRAASAAAPVHLGEWVLELRKVPTIDGALGYHDETDDGNPILRVFPLLCAQDGEPWSICASHEVLEALADPYLRVSVQADDGTFWAQEICDATQSESYAIDGVLVSNFTYPQWGQPPRSGGKFDFLGNCSQPFEVRPGGYAQSYDPAKGWVQRGQMKAYRQALAQLNLSRGARRSMLGAIVG